MDVGDAQARAEALVETDYPSRSEVAAECDLVMKGGITSGVVYPLAVCELARRYRLRNVGGSSAGAIAAAFAAAAEHGRDDGGFARLAALPDEIGERLPSLFAPGPRTRTAHAAVLAAVDPGRTARQRALEISGALLRSQRRTFWGTVAAGAAVSVLLAWFAVGRLDSGLDVARAAVVLGFAGGVALVAASVRALVAEARSTMAGLAAQGFGVCVGSAGAAAGTAEPEHVTDWLAARIDGVAGVAQPLTFGDLRRVGVGLEVMTTDLTHGRPLSFPFRGEVAAYYFDPAELAAYFPPAIVERLVAGRPHEREERGRRLWSVPGADDVPVVFAARISMSFPGLVSAVPLWSDDGDEVVRCWFSDGGLTSNFPIHLFDALWPGRPTFAIDLRPYPHEGAADVDYAGPDARPPRAKRIESPAGFVAAILDTMQYWADDAQAVLPGFRDRVVEVRLAGDEGGMNLRMRKEVVQTLAAKGQEAARVLADGFDFDRHRWARYLTAMGRLQHVTGRLAPLWSGPLPGGEEGYEPLLARAPTAAPPLARDTTWVAQTAVRTRDLLRFGTSVEPDLERGAPKPEPALRITPQY